MLHVWLQAAVAPAWAGDMGRLIDEVTGPGGPATPFVRAGRSKVAVSWMTERGKPVEVSNVSQRSRLDRVLADPMKAGRPSGGSVSVIVWEDGHPFYDGRPEHVFFSIQYGMDVFPRMYVEMWAPLEESAALVSSVKSWVQRWGARFGGGWAQLPDPNDPKRPGWHPYVAANNGMMGVLAMGMVDPVVLGPSWLMVFRPGTFGMGLVPAGSAQSLEVTTLTGPDGDYTMVTLGDDAASVTEAETDRWLDSLGTLMDPVLQDPAAAFELLRAFSEARRVLQTEPAQDDAK